MGGILSALVSSANTLRVYDQALSVVSNNVGNANTPGYAKQSLTFAPLPFDPSVPLVGGLQAGPLLSARSEFLEQAVRNQQQSLGRAQQQAGDLAQVESLFDLTTDAGLSGSLNKFFDSFSQLAVNPNNAVSRQAVIDQAQVVTQNFNRNAVSLAAVSSNADQAARDAVAGVNRIAGQIAAINSQHRNQSNSVADPASDAVLHASLEQLSGLANFTLIRTSDGAFNVYLGGQSPLVVGDRAFSVQADFSSPQTAIRDQQGNDIAPQITDGSLGGILDEKNRLLPGYLSDLNSLAQSFADNVNSGLAQGVDRTGAAPSVDLFTYSLPGAALSLAVSSITPDQIAASLPSAPGGNGNAIALAQLATATVANGFSFTQAYGNLGGRVGLDSANAKQSQLESQDLVTQASALRSSATGVSLNEEAAKLLEFQQAYQAVAKLIAVLDTLTQTILNIVPLS